MCAMKGESFTKCVEMENTKTHCVFLALDYRLTCDRNIAVAPFAIL